MKQLFLLAVSLTLSSVMLAQTDPCTDSRTKNISSVLNIFPSGNNASIPLGTSKIGCVSANNNQDVVLNIQGVEGESSTVSIRIYATDEGSTTLTEVNLPDERTFFTYAFSSSVDQYGIDIQILGSGVFEFALTDPSAPVTGFNNVVVGLGIAPVTWTTPLAARPFGENLQLSFSVADQVDVVGYELERAVGTRPFAKVADIDYVENGSLEVDYSVRTPWVREGSYYRIKQLDYAGTYDYSNVIFVEGNDGAKQRFQMFPNPASDFVRMSLPAEVTSVDLISASGQLLRSAPASEVNRDGLDVRGVSPGLYLVRPVGGDRPSQPQRLVVSH